MWKPQRKIISSDEEIINGFKFVLFKLETFYILIITFCFNELILIW